MPARSTLRWITTLAVGVVLTAACGASTSKGSGTPTSGSATTAKLSASAKGVTADTIKIGFTYPDLEALAKTGLVKVDNGPYAEMIKAIVDDVNTHGGINGRKLEVSIAKFSVLGTAEQLAACTKLTEDDQVFAVLGGFLGDNNLCVTQQHSTLLVSSYGTSLNANLLAKARAPWATATASDERSLKALVKLLDTQGRLKGHTIAVYGQVPNSKNLVDLAVKTLADAGYKAADTAVMTVPASDAQAFNAQDKVLASRFSDKGVDVLFLLGSTPTAANWDSVGWHPSTFLTATDLITPGAYTNPFQKLPIIAAPAASGDPDAAFNTDAMKACRAAYKTATGKDITTSLEEQQAGKSSGLSGMTQACTVLQIFVAAAKAAGPNLNQQTWQTGLESLGKVSLPMAPTASFGPNKHDGQDSFQLEKHDPTWKPNSGKNEFIAIGDPITLS